MRRGDPVRVVHPDRTGTGRIAELWYEGTVVVVDLDNGTRWAVDPRWVRVIDAQGIEGASDSDMRGI